MSDCTHTLIFRELGPDIAGVLRPLSPLGHSDTDGARKGKAAGGGKAKGGGKGKMGKPAGIGKGKPSGGKGGKGISKTVRWGAGALSAAGADGLAAQPSTRRGAQPPQDASSPVARWAESLSVDEAVGQLLAMENAVAVIEMVHRDRINWEEDRIRRCVAVPNS